MTIELFVCFSLDLPMVTLDKQHRPIILKGNSGVSLTHGSARQHISQGHASFKVGRDSETPAANVHASINITVPPFVGEDYFCESGVNSGSATGFHPDDPLWDGQGCSSSSSCCSFNNPPYFTKTLSSPTTDPIEARLCRLDADDDSPVQYIELYVK